MIESNGARAEAGNLEEDGELPKMEICREGKGARDKVNKRSRGALIELKDRFKHFTVIYREV